MKSVFRAMSGFGRNGRGLVWSTAYFVLGAAGLAFAANMTAAALADDEPSSAKTSATAKPDKVAAEKPTVEQAAPEAATAATESKKAHELFEAGRKLFFQADYKGAVEKLTSAAA